MNESKDIIWSSTDNELSARSKVMNNWNSGWKSISKTPPIMPIVDIQMSRPQKADKSDKTVIDVKPKRGRKPKNASNLSFSSMKIKTSSLFKTSIHFSNPFLNSFQQFLNKKSEPSSVSTSVNTSDNSVSVLKLKNYRKPKSQTQILAKKRVIKVMQRIKSSNVLVKRNRKKPLIIKNLTASQSFLDFVSKKFPPIKEGVPFIQERGCKDLIKENHSSNLDNCLDCNEKKGNSQTCRFFQYRTIIKNGDKLSVYAFAEEGNATHDDCKIWLPVSQCKSLDQKTAEYLLIFVGQQFCRIYREEQQIANQCLAVTWKKPVKGIRELCDICETTIFNTHYVCPKCGLAVCVDCFNRRSNSTTTLGHSYNTRKNYDEFGWILCTEKQSHDLKAFHLAIFITQAVFGSIDKIYHRVKNERNILGLCDCEQIRTEINVDMRKVCENFDIRNYCPDVRRYWLCDDRLLVLTDPKNDLNLKLFQINWLKGYPVIIEKVNQSLDRELWTPNSFNFSFGKQSSRLVNCMNGQIIPKRPMSHFWEGFEDIDQRLVDDESGEEMILKLKDWPPNAEFRDMLPLWFDNLMDALPLPEYTRYNGNRNLASRLPEFFVRPDLGPKMYCAYGSVLHPEKGTTNLHLDMSDAVNVMIYVGVAHQNQMPLQTHLSKANDTLMKGGCDQEMMARANSDELKVGALWHIWKAEDADKIRYFLNKVAKENNMRIEANNDPIHDQSWYLDEILRTRLEDEYNVKGLAIAQCLGDAILVPAGAPHQVQNIHSCIKVAGEFVSPENVAHCLAMTQQFRNLSKRHNNHEDKLQIKNIIYHTIKDSLSVLLPPTPNYFSIPSPPKLVSKRLSPLSDQNSMTAQISTVLTPQFMDAIKEEKYNSLDTPLEPFLSNIEDNCESSQTSITNPDPPHNCRDVSVLSNTCILNDESVDHKTTDSVNLMQNICCEMQSTKPEVNGSHSESPQKSDISLPPPLVNPNHNSNESESTFGLPPILTPYSYSDESISTSIVNQHNDCPLNSSQITSASNN